MLGQATQIVERAVPQRKSWVLLWEGGEMKYGKKPPKDHCRVLLTQCPREWGTVSQAITTVGSAMVLELKPLCHLGLSFDH